MMPCKVKRTHYKQIKIQATWYLILQTTMICYTCLNIKRMWVDVMTQYLQSNTISNSPYKTGVHPAPPDTDSGQTVGRH